MKKIKLDFTLHAIYFSNLDLEHFLLITALLDDYQKNQYKDRMGKRFYHFGYEEISYWLEILCLGIEGKKNRKSKIYRMFRHLIDLGYLEAYPKNQEIGQTYFAFTELTTLHFTRNSLIH